MKLEPPVARVLLRGSLSATIPVENTGSLTTYKLTEKSQNVISSEGLAGGRVNGNYMIYIVFKGSNEASRMGLQE
ncbi:hypothetical protein [Paenibacillus maysiensis]|uniref:hypothetical protein n=1 Tax=Paenibacillus maysiensis TaxID=1155954 RepID=UPI00047164E7|nr:hypothetical protein [Paenibacillus maysiensis]